MKMMMMMVLYHNVLVTDDISRTVKWEDAEL